MMAIYAVTLLLNLDRVRLKRVVLKKFLLGNNQAGVQNPFVPACQHPLL